MWQIMKAEIHYNRWMLLVSLAAMVLISVLGVSTIEHMDWMIWLPFFMIFENLNKTHRREKRNRQVVHLPLPLKKIGTTRITLLYLIYFCGGLIWLPMLMQSEHVSEPNDAWVMIAAGMMVLNVFTASTIKQNLNVSHRRWRMWFWYGAFAYAALLIGLFSVVLTYQGDTYAPALVKALTDYSIIPIVTFLPVPVLYFVAIFSYNNRHSYLDERTGLCG